MAQAKKIKEIPSTLTIGKGKKKEVFTHYISLKSSEAAIDSKEQIKSHFKKVRIEEFILDGSEIHSIYIIRND